MDSRANTFGRCGRDVAVMETKQDCDDEKNLLLQPPRRHCANPTSQLSGCELVEIHGGVVMFDVRPSSVDFKSRCKLLLHLLFMNH